MSIDEGDTPILLSPQGILFIFYYFKKIPLHHLEYLGQQVEYMVETHSHHQQNLKKYILV